MSASLLWPRVRVCDGVLRVDTTEQNAARPSRQSGYDEKRERRKKKVASQRRAAKGNREKRPASRPPFPRPAKHLPAQRGLLRENETSRRFRRQMPLANTCESQLEPLCLPGATAHRPGDVIEAVEFNVRRCPEELTARCSPQIRELRQEAKIRMRETRHWRSSLSEAHGKEHRWVNPPLAARALEELGTGGQLGVRSLRKGFRRKGI